MILKNKHKKIDITQTPYSSTVDRDAERAR